MLLERVGLLFNIFKCLLPKSINLNWLKLVKKWYCGEKMKKKDQILRSRDFLLNKWKIADQQLPVKCHDIKIYHSDLTDNEKKSDSHAFKETSSRWLDYYTDNYNNKKD